VSELTIVIPATRPRPELERCLEAVRRAARPEDRVLVVASPPSGSPALARNAGAAVATTELVLFVDADVIVQPDAVERVRAAFAADPTLDAIFGAYDDTTVGGLVASFRNLLHHHVHATSAGEAETFWAGIGAVRRSAFERVNGFDTVRYPRPMLEDVELGIRLRRAGLRVVLDPAIRGAHLKRWTLRSMVRSDVLDRGIPWTRLVLTYRRVPTTLNLGWRHRVSALAVGAGLVAAARGRWRAVAAGLGALVVLNRDFYALLARRLGARQLPLAVALHALHHACGIAAVPLGVVAHIRRRGRPEPLDDLELSGARRAVTWALGQVAATQSGSAPDIDAWTRASGYSERVPWCQCFVNAAAAAGGAPQLASGFCPDILRGLDGYEPISEEDARAGDFVYFKWPGLSDQACDHVGLLTAAPGTTDGVVHTIEGDTSVGADGSQHRGGGVHLRIDRSKALVAGYIRPPYPR
jgi:GT2 family glycosyltransferase